MENELRNKVTESGIITINPENYFPKEDIVVFDIKDFLFMEMILKEKDFREKLKSLDWTPYNNKTITITCSADAIIPMWAYMLVVTYLQPIAHKIFVGTKEDAQKELLLQNIRNINTADFVNKRLVIKGCGDLSIGDYAYAEITKVLLPIAKSLMYGEPCSTVPVYKKKV